MMPFKFVNEQKQFQWITTPSGLPIGNVLRLGNGSWLTVCPLCGMAHDVTGIRGDEYQPTCELRLTHPTVFANWRRRYPDAAQHTTIYLRRSDTLIFTVLDHPQILEWKAG